MNWQSKFVCGLMVILAGCAGASRSAQPIYQDEFLSVRLEPNPAGDSQAREGMTAPVLTPEQLSAVLQGLFAHKKSSFLQGFVDAQYDVIFRESEMGIVSRELQKGLKIASSQERVAFQVLRPRGKGQEETSGAIYQRGRLLYVSVKKFRAMNITSYKDAELGSGVDFELLYEPSDALVQRQQGFAKSWLGADVTEVIIDTQRVVNGKMSDKPAVSQPMPVAPAPAKPAPVPPPAVVSPATAAPAVTIETLQQQVKDLAESNEALRAKVKQLQQGQGATQTQPSNDELIRLRQELEETKQLLADKVLELNRLQKQQQR